MQTANPGPTSKIPRATLEFREVMNEFAGAQAGTCFVLGDQASLRSRDGKICYEVGPVLLDGTRIGSAQAVVDTQGQWIVVVTFTNDDFVNKVAKPLVNKRIAIVIDGVVESTPTINPGITGRQVTISGSFTEAEAHRLAAALTAP